MVKSLPSLQAWVAACAILLPCAPGMAQRPTPATPATLIHVDNGNPALVTDRHLAAQSAGYRALYYCSGIFSAGLPDALLEESISRRASRDARTVIDREKKIVSVYFAPGHGAAYRGVAPWFGCTQLPIGATCRRGALAAHAANVTVPTFDARPWPMGDANATATAVRMSRAARSPTVLDEAFNDQAGTRSRATPGASSSSRTARSSPSATRPAWDAHVAARTNSMCKSIRRLARWNRRAGGHAGPAPEGAARRRGSGRATRAARSRSNNLLHMASGLYTEAGGDPQLELYGAARRG